MNVATNPDLLKKISEASSQAEWTEFYNKYATLITGFARYRGCSQEAANDVLQETMVCLMRQMKNFKYNGRKGAFRNYLRRIVSARINDAFRRESRFEPLVITENGKTVDRTPYAKCHLQETIEEWDRFWNYSLILKALDHTYERVGVTTAESFKMYVLENRPVNEVATKLGIKPNAVYQHRNRVLKRAQEHLKFIKTEIGE